MTNRIKDPEARIAELELEIAENERQLRALARNFTMDMAKLGIRAGIVDGEMLFSIEDICRVFDLDTIPEGITLVPVCDSKLHVSN